MLLVIILVGWPNLVGIGVMIVHNHVMYGVQGYPIRAVVAYVFTNQVIPSSKKTMFIWMCAWVYLLESNSSDN